MSVLHVGLGHARSPQEAVQQAMQSTAKPELAIVFAASAQDGAAVYQTVREGVGERCAVIGGSTSGEFSSLASAPTDGSVVVMTLQSSYLSVGLGVGTGITADPVAAGREAAIAAYSSLKSNPVVTSMTTIAMTNKHSSEVARIKPFVSLVLPDGSSGGEEAFLRSILIETGKVSQIVGGSAGNDFSGNNHIYQFANGVYQDAGVMALLSSALKIGTGMGHPYYPTEYGMAVTRGEGRTVYELDGKPAAAAMKELLGVAELTPEVFAANPMGVKSADVFGQYTIKSVMNGNEDGSLSFYAEVPKGAYLVRMQTDRDYAIESFREVLRNALRDAGNPKKVGAVVVFNCILRHLLKCRLDINDLAIYREIFGTDVPMIGFNTFGEQGTTLGGSLGHYNQTATVLVIADETITQ
ncbi:MAG: FIST N-terminal domain-containing protein [Thiolinea sp.]